MIEERDGTGSTVTAAYFYAGGVDQPVGMIKSGSAYYFQQDALGNVTALTDASGSLVEQYSYDVYGKPTIKDGSGNAKTSAMTPFLFTGREYDSETGLYHYRARAYSPSLGRFLSRDPLTMVAGDVNLYRYVGNNVVNFTDSLGTDWEVSGTAPAKANTVVTKNGQLTVQLTDRSATTPENIIEGARLHEESHIQDALAENPNIAKGKPDGMRLGNSDVRTLALSEVKATNVELNYLKGIPQTAAVKYRIRQQEEYLKFWKKIVCQGHY